MNKFTKKQLLVGALILLFVINIAALVTIIYQNYQYKKDTPVSPFEQRELAGRRSYDNERIDKKNRFPGRKHEQGSGSDRFMKKRLQLDEKQFNQFQQLNDEIRSSQQRIVRELSQKRDTLMNELTKTNPDTSKMNQLAEEIGELHTRLKRNTIEHFQKMKALCRPEQRERLNTMIMEMTRRGMHEPGRGMGPAGGPRHMKRK